MRNFLSIALVLCLLAAPAAARAPEHAGVWNGAEIAWRDIASGIPEATRTGRPVIMLFQATWCPSCRQYRQVFKDPRIVEASKSFVMILVDVDKDTEANSAFSPDGTYVPRTIFFDAEGNIQSSIRGADSEYPHSIDIKAPDELLGLMQKAKALLTPEQQRASDN